MLFHKYNYTNSLYSLNNQFPIFQDILSFHSPLVSSFWPTGALGSTQASSHRIFFFQYKNGAPRVGGTFCRNKSAGSSKVGLLVDWSVCGTNI